MACIKSAQRAALSVLAPDAPYLAASTMTGAVDLSFSNSANIEIFRLDFLSNSPDLSLLASAPAPDRFNRLSWSRPGAVEGDSFALGLLVGGLSDGPVAVWNPLSMISSEGKAEDAMVARLEKHTGPRGSRLASGAEQGELCIWDLKNPVEPIVYPPLKIADVGVWNELGAKAKAGKEAGSSRMAAAVVKLLRISQAMST